MHCLGARYGSDPLYLIVALAPHAKPFQMTLLCRVTAADLMKRYDLPDLACCNENMRMYVSGKSLGRTCG